MARAKEGANKRESKGEKFYTFINAVRLFMLDLISRKHVIIKKTCNKNKIIITS